MEELSENSGKKALKANFSEYLETIKTRAKESRVYSKHQLLGLSIAELLNDNEHKALYMKLAKSSDGEALLDLAKRVAENEKIRKKGAYFMAIWKKDYGNRNNKGQKAV